MDILPRLQQLLDEKGWSRYKLSKESGLAEETLTNIFRRGTTPSLVTLEAICKGFRITLSQFFAEDKMIEVNDELKNLFDHWKYLTPTQKDAVFQIMKAMKNESNS